ncbi:hypothetical protein H8959_012028 [Pygathrix nigripes]
MADAVKAAEVSHRLGEGRRRGERADGLSSGKVEPLMKREATDGYREKARWSPFTGPSSLMDSLCANLARAKGWQRPRGPSRSEFRPQDEESFSRAWIPGRWPRCCCRHSTALPPPAPAASQQGPAEEAAEALLTETVRSQTHSLPAPESPEPAAPPRPQTPENGPEASDPSEELEALASLLQELRDFSPSSAKRQQETAAAETETRTHTLTRVNLESPGPERVWRASWGEFQARVPERAPLPPPAPSQFQARMPESGPLPETHKFGEGVSSPKTHLGEALAPLSKAYQGLAAPFPKARRPESALLGGSEAGERLLQQGLAQVEAGRRQAEATRQAAAQEERLADLASDLLLQYLLQGGARQRGLGVGAAEAAEERESAREEEAEQERRGGEERVGEEDEEAAEAEAEAEEAERARQNALLFAEEEDGEAGAEDKRSQEETPGHRRKEAEGAEEGGEEDDDEEMDPQTIDSLIELSTKLHLPADDVVSIIEEVEEKRKRKKNAPPEPVPPPRAAPAPTHVRSPQPPAPGPRPR